MSHVTNKISRGLGMMGRCRNLLSNEIMLMLYYSLVYPYLIYCCIVWGGACVTALHKIQVLQNRAVRLITRAPFRASTDPLFLQLRILQVVDIRRLQIAIFMYKCKNLLLPQSCLHYCLLNLRNNLYNMRTSHYFITPRYRTNIREQCISCIGPKIWDTLQVFIIYTVVNAANVGKNFWSHL